MLALAWYRRQVGPCGHYLPDTTAAEAEDTYAADDPVRCHACNALSVAATRYKDDPHPGALLFHPERRG